MKYKVGDKVRIKSLDWYNENKDEYGYINCGSRAFFTKMSNWCGKIATIKEICKTNCYRLEEYDFDWTDEMIEGLVEDEMVDLTSIVMETVEEKTIQNALTYGYNLPEGYQFVDENGNVINATKIVLEKKKKEYPKTYEECCEIVGFGLKWDNPFRINRDTHPYMKHLDKLMRSLCKLLICRDAYWKIYGEEMGLGKPWKPDWKDDEQGRYMIMVYENELHKDRSIVGTNFILVFPTEEMVNAFYKNFKELIEKCKELL